MLAQRELTEEQRTVVSAADGPLLVIAGPGSGKTRVLAARVCHLIADQRVSPARILILTFATKAAGELRTRLVARIGASGQAVDVATYHSFGWRVVRRWQADLGFGPGPLRVCSHGEQQWLLDRAAQGLGLPSLSATVELHDLHAYRVHGDASASTLLPALVTVYEELLCQHGVIDYPSMLILPLRLLDGHPAALRTLQDAYDHVLADEFQDTSLPQYALLRALTARHRNLLLVGDPDQCIYQWRGADGSAFHAFARDFPDARLCTLTQNFRSCGRIVALANAVRPRLLSQRDLWTAHPPGELPVLWEARDEQAEAVLVAREIARLRNEHSVRNLGEVTVLYRTHAQAPPLVTALQQQGIPSMQMRTTDDASLSATDRVRLMTVHAAKGGEWPVVFLVGAEEGLLPHAQADDATVADERNIAYVAVTRAMDRLYVTHGRHRLSRFFAGLPEGLVARQR